MERACQPGGDHLPGTGQTGRIKEQLHMLGLELLPFSLLVRGKHPADLPPDPGGGGRSDDQAGPVAPLLYGPTQGSAITLCPGHQAETVIPAQILLQPGRQCPVVLIK